MKKAVYFVISILFLGGSLSAQDVPQDKPATREPYVRYSNFNLRMTQQILQEMNEQAKPGSADKQAQNLEKSFQTPQEKDPAIRRVARELGKAGDELMERLKAREEKKKEIDSLLNGMLEGSKEADGTYKAAKDWKEKLSRAESLMGDSAILNNQVASSVGLLINVIHSIRLEDRSDVGYTVAQTLGRIYQARMEVWRKTHSFEFDNSMDELKEFDRNAGSAIADALINIATSYGGYDARYYLPPSQAINELDSIYRLGQREKIEKAVIEIASTNKSPEIHETAMRFIEKNFPARAKEVKKSN